MKTRKLTALLLGIAVFLSVIPFSAIIADATDDDAAKIETIKAAWTALEEKAFEVAPERHVKGLDSYNQAAFTNTTYLSDGAKAEIPATVGSNYAAVTLTDKSGATADVRGNGEFLYLTSANKPSDYKVHLSFYVDSIAEGGELSFVPYFRSGGNTGVGTGKLYTVTSADVGKWVTLDEQDLAGYAYSNVPNLGNGILFGINSTGTNSIVFGNFIFAQPISLPEGSEGWTFKEWIINASELDLSNYYNTEQFEATIDELETEELKQIKAIRTAWSNLEEISFEVTPNSKLNELDTYNQAAFTNTSYLPDGAKTEIPIIAGSRYAAAVAINKSGSTPAARGNAGILFNASPNKPSDYKVHFSFYVDSIAENGEISFVPFFRSGGSTGVDSGKLYTVKASDVGKWVTLDEKDIAGASYTNVTNLINSITLGINSTGNNSIVFGSFVFTQKVTLPENSMNWSFEEWLEAAKALDISSYYNAEQFAAALAEVDASELGKINRIKAAWTALEKEEFEVAPERHVKGLDSYIQAAFTNTTYLSDGAKAEIPATVGSNYAAVTLTDKSGATSDVRGNAEFLYLTSANKPSDYKVHLSFYVDSIAEGGELSFVPYFRSTDATGVGSGKLYTVTSADVGKWVTLDEQDLAGNAYTNAPNLGNGILFGINSTGTNSIVFGNFIFAQPISLPEGSDSWTFNEWITNASNLDLSNYYNTEQFEAMIDELEPEELKQIKAIRTAWSNLEEIDFEVTANSKLNELDTYNQAAFTNTSYLPDGAKTGIPIIAGSHYAAVEAIDKSGSTPAARGNAGIKFNASANKPSDYKVHFSFYVESIAEGGEISFVPYFRYGSTGGENTGKLYTVKASDIGKWVTLDEKDLAGTYYKNATNLNNCIILGINSTGSNSIVFGSFVFTQEVTLPENSDEWNLAKWVSNAKALDVSNCYNAAQFTAAIAAAEQVVDDLGIPYGDINEIPADISSLGANRLAGLTPEVSYFNGVNPSNINVENIGLITDGNTATSVSIGLKPGNDKYVDVIYNLAGYVNAEKLLIAGMTAGEFTSYEIYISTVRSALFNNENRIIKANSGISESSGQLLNLFTATEGCYIGFRFTGSDSDNLDIAELGLYGTQSEYMIEKGNFDSAKLNSIGYNLLKDAPTPVLRWNDVNARSITYSLENLSDSDPSTVFALEIAEWNAGEDTSRHMDIYYDLGALYEIDKLQFNSFDTKYLECGEYEIYVSGTMTDIISDDNLVLNYNNRSDSENGTTVSQLFTLINGKVGRYVCFRIRSSVSDWVNADSNYSGLLYVRMTDLGVYGTAYTPEAVDYTGLVNSNTVSSLYTMNYLNKAFYRITDYENKEYQSTLMSKKYMTDGNPFTVFDIYAAESGISSIDIILDLGDQYIIDNAIFKAGSDENHWPSGMKIYVGETETTVRNAAAISVGEFSSKTEDGVYSCDFAPQYARYVRFQITESNNPYLTAHMLTVISELEVNGYSQYKGAVSGANYGDLNSDGKVDIMDFVRMKKNISNEVQYILISDLDKDTKITSSDLILMKKFLLGIIAKF